MPRRVVKKLNSIGRIGRRGAMDRFDPNAVDADDDGLVQEQTRFERPAPPRISGSVSGRQMTPEMVERDKEIIRRRNEGQQTQQIADDMGISLPTVNYALYRGRKRGEVTYVDNTNQPKPDRDAEIIKRFIAGETQQSIARDLGMPAATIANVVSRARKRGESIPFKETKKKKPKTTSEETAPTLYESVEKLNNEGKSVAEIAQELNVKERDVVQALVQNRTMAEANNPRRGIRGAMGRGTGVRLGKEEGRKLDEYIKNNPNESTVSIAEKFGVGRLAVLNRFKKLGLFVTQQDKNAEIDEYIKNNPDESNASIAKKFKSNVSTIGKRREALGLAPTWILTEDEIKEVDEVIKNNPTVSTRELARITGKSTTTIRKRREALGIQKPKSESQYITRTPVEKIEAIDADIKRDSTQFTTEIARRHGVSEAIVRARRQFLNLPSPIVGSNIHPYEVHRAVEKDLKNNPELTSSEIAKNNNVSISFVIGKRRALDMMRNPTKKETENRIGKGGPIPESIKDEIVQEYLNRKLTIEEIAKKFDVSEGSVGNVLKERKIERNRGLGYRPSPVKPSSRKTVGTIGTGRKELMQKYVDEPSLDVDAETIAESIGFWGGWNIDDLQSRPDYNYANHPQFFYDLQTGKPVRILGSRADSPELIEKIVKEGKYVIPSYEGSYGRGGNFAFDGDPLMGEVYSENIARAEYPGNLQRVNRLITRIDLRNPIVVNVGVLDIDENTRISEMNWNGPREKRIATRWEASAEYIKQLGGEDRVRELYKRLLDIENNKPEESEKYGFFVEKISDASESKEDRLKRYKKIIDGGEIDEIPPQEFNRLARIAGHDGIVRLAIGHYESDTSHIIVLDERRIKVIGKRPAYSEETIKNRELEMVETMRRLVNKPKPIHPGFHAARFINESIGEIEEMLEDKETNPDSWTELDDKAIIRQANIILMYYGEAKAKIKFAKDNDIETTDEIKNTLEEGLQIALATKGLKRRKTNKLSGSIRRPEPEVWEMPEEDVIPFDVGDYDNELEGGALYDEMIGPKPRVSRPNDRKPLTAESATQRRTALIAGGFVNLDDEIQVRDGKSISQQALEAIARDFKDDKLSMSEIAKKYKVSPSLLRKKFPEISSSMSRNRRRNDLIRQEFLDGASLSFLSDKYNISITHLRQNIVSDLLKERGDAADAQERYKDKSSRRINRRSRKNSKKTKPDKPNLSGSVGPNKDTAANVPTEPLVTPGGISGSMSNENFNVGLKLKTKTKISPLENGLFQVDVDYGDLTINAEVDLDNYSSYKDAYDSWIDWDGNYGMRVASAALMGENLPEAWGYRGGDDGTHHHDVISTGVMASGARESLPTVEKQVTDALIALHHINTGKETNIRPIYRGVSNVTAGNELLGLGSGSVITMPLSAFTADRKVANLYATGMGKTNDGLILEVLPGARVGDAAGDQYLHRFDLIDDKGNVEGSAVDVTESITQGKFKFVGMSTILVPNQSGGNDSVKKITLEQIETFNPINGSYEKNSGKLAGSMSSKRDQFLARVGEVRPITQGLVPGDVQSLQARAVEMYVQRSPVLIKQLSDIEKHNTWQTAADAINPDGSRMSKEQYIAFKTNEIRQMGNEYASRRLNKQDPDTRPRHIEQLQHNVDLMFAASPELQMLCEQYGYPLYAIFNAQEVRDKDGKNVWKSNTEAHENNMAGLANGVTLWGLGISAIYPYSDDAFIPEGMPFGQAIQDPRRLLNGHWGIRPESYGTGIDTDPMSLHRLLIEQHMGEYEKLGRRPDITDVNTPIGTLRHETSHNIHSGAVAKALLDVLENPSIENREKYSLLALLFKPSWQAAFAASAGNSKQVQMMYDQAVSDYAASSPPEWFAETLSAALSPSEKTRALLNFNHRGILAVAIPELREYLIEGDWP